MHKHVLIPTDFQMDSLNTIKKVIHDMNDEDTVAVTLLHGYYLNDSITDLLFNSRKDILKEIASAQNDVAKKQIEDFRKKHLS